MMFQTRERRVWMRLDNHAVVWDRDPDFKRFCRDERGTLLRILHVWLAGSDKERAAARAYIGAIRLGRHWPRREELSRILRRAGACAHLAGKSPRVVRRQLADLLRTRISG